MYKDYETSYPLIRNTAITLYDYYISRICLFRVTKNDSFGYKNTAYNLAHLLDKYIRDMPNPLKLKEKPTTTLTENLTLKNFIETFVHKSYILSAFIHQTMDLTIRLEKVSNAPVESDVIDMLRFQSPVEIVRDDDFGGQQEINTSETLTIELNRHLSLQKGKIFKNHLIFYEKTDAPVKFSSIYRLIWKQLLITSEILLYPRIRLSCVHYAVLEKEDKLVYEEIWLIQCIQTESFISEEEAAAHSISVVQNVGKSLWTKLNNNAIHSFSKFKIYFTVLIIIITIQQPN